MIDFDIQERGLNGMSYEAFIDGMDIRFSHSRQTPKKEARVSIKLISYICQQ